MTRRNIGRIIGIVLFVLIVVGSCTFYIYDKQKTKKAEAKAKQEQKVQEEKKKVEEKLTTTKDWGDNVVTEDEDINVKIYNFFEDKFKYYQETEVSEQELEEKKKNLEADYKNGVIEKVLGKNMEKDLFDGNIRYHITNFSIYEISKQSDTLYLIWFNADYTTKNIKTGETGTDSADHYNGYDYALGAVTVNKDGSLTIISLITPSSK